MEKQLKAFPLKDWEVRALKAHNKTEKRFPIKPQPKFKEGETGVPELMDDGSWQFKIQQYESIWDCPVYPRWQKGDLVYVQEAWGTYNGDYFLYRADYPDGAKSYDYDGVKCDMPRWCSSTQMTPDIARTFLRIVDVRVERLQDITEEQAMAEGCETGSENVSGGPWGVEDSPEVWTAKEEYAQLWDEAQGKGSLTFYGWDTNPWCLVYTFEEVKEEDIMREVNG